MSDLSLPLQAALAEVKAYEQMALLAAAFAFAHSKWNGEAGPEQVVFKVCGARADFQSRPALTPAPVRQKQLTHPWWPQPLPQFSVTHCTCESSQGHKSQQQRLAKESGTGKSPREALARASCSSEAP